MQWVSQERVRNDKERWLTLEEEERLLAFSPKWLQELITFAVNTRLRQSEILNLQWTHVDLFRRTITILEQKNRGKDTLQSQRCCLAGAEGESEGQAHHIWLRFFQWKWEPVRCKESAASVLFRKEKG